MGKGPLKPAGLKEAREKNKENKPIRGGVAQLGEHLPCKQGVKSSNLSISTARTLNENEPLGEV